MGLCFLAILIGAGIRSAPAVLIHPLEAEFGWSRAAISSAISINLLLYGLAAPLSGWLLDHLGPRRVMLGSLVLLAAGVSAAIFVAELWHLILFWGIVVGLGAGGVASVLAAAVAHRWFVARRGLVLGILNSASSTGQLIFIPFFMAMIVVSGWRVGSLTMAVVTLLILFMVFFWMRDEPSEVGLEPYGSQEDLRRDRAHAEATATLAVSAWQAFATRPFWLLAGSFFICGATSNGLIGTHLIPHSIDYGIPGVVAATTVGVMGGMNFVGTTISGYMTDRVDPRRILAVVYGLRSVSLFVLPYVTDFSGLFIFAVIYGLDWFASVPPTVALTGQAFGKHAVGRVYGWIFLSHQLGAALAATVGGAMRVHFGDYQLAFMGAGVLGLVAVAMALMIPQQPRMSAPETGALSPAT